MPVAGDGLMFFMSRRTMTITSKAHTMVIIYFDWFGSITKFLELCEILFFRVGGHRIRLVE